MDEDVCRVCRTESSVDHPLFYPCKCSGSIRYVHQDCLTKWLKHSGKTKCELCNHSFSFSPIYGEDVPEFIPVLLFFRRGVHHLIGLVKIGLRAMLVGSVWLICLPYFTVWVWRFYFWSGEYIAYRINGQYPPFRAENGINNSTREENPFSILYLKIAKELLWYLPPEVENVIKEFGEFTSDFFADAFEGQIITCVVVIIFVAAFLLREWIIQNTQPEDNLLNEEELDHENEMAQQGNNDNDNLINQRLQAHPMIENRVVIPQNNNDDDDDDNTANLLIERLDPLDEIIENNIYDHRIIDENNNNVEDHESNNKMNEDGIIEYVKDYEDTGLNKDDDVIDEYEKIENHRIYENDEINAIDDDDDDDDDDDNDDDNDNDDSSINDDGDGGDYDDYDDYGDGINNDYDNGINNDYDNGIINEDDNIINEDNDIINEDDDVINEDDDIINEDGDIINEDDDIINENDDIINEDGDIINEDDDIIK